MALGYVLPWTILGPATRVLGYLRRLPLDKVKIDKSLIGEIGSARSDSVIQAVVALSHAIGLEVTAEGVETRNSMRS